MLPASQYDLLQPRFKEQAPPMATRDRFRSRSKSGVAYDDVEDDYNYNGGQELELELDSFGEA